MAVGGLDLRLVEKWALVFLAAVALGSLMLGYRSLAAGFAVGGAISIINFKWLGFFYGRVLPRGSSRLRFFAILFYIGRYLAIGAALYLVISRGIASGISLLIGLSMIYLVVAFFGLLRLGHKD